MKKLIIFALCAGFLSFASCDNAEQAFDTANQKEALNNQQASQTRVGATNWDMFTNVPASVREDAERAWGDDVPPALTVAFTWGSTGAIDNWPYSIYTSERPRCELQGYGDPRNPHSLVTPASGFSFFEEGELCAGEAAYILDNRQDQAFEAWCGPNGRNFTYDGTPLFIYVRMWCE